MELERPLIPGVGPSALPRRRLEAEERPRGGPLSREAVRALEADLRRALEGEVRFDEGSRAAYANDGSNYRQVPIGVVIPRSTDDVVAAIRVCRAHGAPILSRGGGTSLAGQCCNVAVVLDHSKYVNRLLALDPDRQMARVEPGLVLDALRAAAERHHLTFGPDPSTHTHCTLGGMIGNDSCGVHSVMAGRTTHNVLRLEVLTYDGERLWVGPTSATRTRSRRATTSPRSSGAGPSGSRPWTTCSWATSARRGSTRSGSTCSPRGAAGSSPSSAGRMRARRRRRPGARDCPVNVDVATYKAEFLSHHYRRRLRPPAAYTMGLVMYWARAAGLVPALVNALGRAPLLAAAGKRLAGLAPRRELPRFAPVTLQRWWARRPRAAAGGERVVLFADTFTNAFHPEVGTAAVEALERAGFAPALSAPGLCCGRPLYDFGMLDLARALLRWNLAALRPAVEAGIPVVFLEPSCAAVFRDELPDLLHGEPGAQELAARTRLLAELLDEAGASHPVPRLSRRAVVQIHCHQHAVMGRDATLNVLGRMGLDVAALDEGCCGMAGAFGFEAGRKYELSIAVGERGVLPAVRATPAEDLVLADGFSCRTQLAQGAGRRALHLAEVLRLAQEPAAAIADPAAWAEARRPRRTGRDVGREVAVTAGLVGAALAGAAAAVRTLRRG